MEINLSTYFSGLNLLLGMCAFVLTSMCKHLFAPFWKKPLGKRLLPIVPVAISVTLAFLGLREPTIQTWQETLAIGLVAGFSAAYLWKVGRASLLGEKDE